MSNISDRSGLPASSSPNQSQAPPSVETETSSNHDYEEEKEMNRVLEELFTFMQEQRPQHIFNNPKSSDTWGEPADTLAGLAGGGKAKEQGESDYCSLASSGSDEPEDECEGLYATEDMDPPLCKLCEEFLNTFRSGHQLPPNEDSKKDEAFHYKYPKTYPMFWNLSKSAITCSICQEIYRGTMQYVNSFRCVPYRDPRSRQLEIRGYEMFRGRYPLPYTWRPSLQEADITDVEIVLGYCLDDPRFRFLIKGADSSGRIPKRAIWSQPGIIGLKDRTPVFDKWIRICHSRHATCRQRRETGRKFLPTRLVDLQDAEGKFFRPRLVDTATLDPQKVRYTTLSHRWGGLPDKQPLRTLKENMEKHSDAVFPTDEHGAFRVPKTFADAIHITEAVGAQYIWIDSLCIVQDDHDDWRREALRMGDVYKGGTMNIAAIDSTSCFAGCSLEVRGPAIVTLKDGSTIAVRAPAADPADVYESLLNSRGWVFQELMLAPRILYCGKNQFYWQCQEAVYSEDGYIDHTMPLNVPGERNGDEEEEDNGDFDMGHDYPWQLWVRDYSKRFFTMPSDRLPALRSVVLRYQQETGHTPVLGLWKESLIDHLAWRTRHVEFNVFSAFPTERANIPNMPSWSWLSLHCNRHEGGVIYFLPMEERRLVAEVIEVDVQWEEEPFMSAIRSTKLILKGPFKKMSFQYDGIRRRLHPEGGEERRNLEEFVIRMDDEIEEKSWAASREIREYWCFQLDSAIGEDNYRRGGCMLVWTFLVLEEVNKDALPRTFRRIGCGRMGEDEIDFKGTDIEELELV